MVIREISKFPERKKVHLYTVQEALKPLNKRYWSNKQHRARLTRWLHGLTHLSRNPLGMASPAIPEETYAEEYVINHFTQQAELNSKYGSIFADQSRCNKTRTERKRVVPENKIEPLQTNQNLDENKTTRPKLSKTKRQNPGTPILAH